MRRASLKFLYHLVQPNPLIPQFPLFPRSTNVINAYLPHSRFPTKSLVHFSDFIPRRFHLGLSHHFSTYADLRRSEVKNRFRSSKTLDEMLAAFADAEGCFQESELGEECMNISMGYYREGVDYEKSLCFGKRALRILVNREDSVEMSVYIALVIQVSGLACIHLGRKNESLGYLTRARKLLYKLKGNSSYRGSEHVLKALNETEGGLFHVKRAWGKREEAVIHLRKAIGIQETMEVDSLTLSRGYTLITHEYFCMKNYVEALPFGLKALEVLRRDPTHNPLDAVACRRTLGAIYSELNEEENALEQNQISLSELSCDSVLFQVQAAHIQLNLGRYDQAVDTLTAAMPNTEEECEERALVMASMGKALWEQNVHRAKSFFNILFWKQDKLETAKRCLEISFRIFDKQETCHSPHLVVASLIETSDVYEKMKENEAAIHILRRLLQIVEKLPQEYHFIFGTLLLYNGQLVEILPYIEDSLGRLKQSSGSKSIELAAAYNNLGAVYRQRSMEKSSLRVVEYAKDILDDSRGSNHLASLMVSKNVARAYMVMGRNSEAINLLEKVIEGLKGYVPDAQDHLDEATELMDQLIINEKTRK